MRLTKSLWMSAVLSAGLFGASPRANAASNPATAQIRFNCASQACNALSGTFAGRLDWYSGNVLLFSESGTFTALANKDLSITLSGNGSGATFQSTYVDSATSILAAPDLTVKVYSTAVGDTLLLSQPYQPETSALWAKHSEDAVAETTRAMAAESTLNTALNVEIGKRAAGISTETSRATAAESALQSSLDNEIAARKAADSALTSSVANEVARAQGAESALSANLASESSSRIAGDNSLLAQINSLISSLQSEISNRINGENSLTNAINNEVSRAQSAEAAALASAKSYTDTKTPWPQSCKVNQIIQMTANGWACADPASGSSTGFPSSSIVNSTQGAQINTWIGSPSQLWKLCYSRNVDGASSSTFHNKCDNQGPAVTLIKADNGSVWGGYSSPSWQSPSNYFGDSNSFLFTVTNNGKLPFGTGVFGPNPYAMYGSLSYGPTFGGGHDMHLDGNMTTGYCNVGYSYGCRVGGNTSAQCQNDLCGSYSNWNATSVEVWIKDAGGAPAPSGAHSTSQLTTDYTSSGGCGDYSTWYTQNFGPMTYDQCETLANKYGAQYVGSPNLYSYNAPYGSLVRWVGEVDANTGYVSTGGWNSASTAAKSSSQNCVLGYANGTQHGSTTFSQGASSANGKSYVIKDLGSISEATCYSAARDAGARPLNPVMFNMNNGQPTHMVENHSCHGSLEYNGGSYSADGGASHTYRCFIGYNP